MSNLYTYLTIPLIQSVANVLLREIHMTERAKLWENSQHPSHSFIINSERLL